MFSSIYWWLKKTITTTNAPCYFLQEIVYTIATFTDFWLQNGVMGHLNLAKWACLELEGEAAELTVCELHSFSYVNHFSVAIISEAEQTFIFPIDMFLLIILKGIFLRLSILFSQCLLIWKSELLNEIAVSYTYIPNSWCSQCLLAHEQVGQSELNSRKLC